VPLHHKNDIATAAATTTIIIVIIIIITITITHRNLQRRNKKVE